MHLENKQRLIIQKKTPPFAPLKGGVSKFADLIKTDEPRDQIRPDTDRR